MLPQVALPKYPGKWDGKQNSTLRKLEAASSRLLKDAGLLGDAKPIEPEEEVLEDDDDDPEDQ